MRYLDPIAASGLLSSDGVRVALACRDFHPQAPKELRVEGGVIDLSLYRSFDDTPLRLWRGTAKTHEIHVILMAAEPLRDEADVLSYKRLVLALEAHWRHVLAYHRFSPGNPSSGGWT